MKKESKTESKKENKKNNYRYLIYNSLIMFMLCYLTLLITSLIGDYHYYSTYEPKELLEFFSMKDLILFRIEQSFETTLFLPIFFVPIIYFVSKLQVKKIYRFFIAIAVTIVVVFSALIIILMF